MSLNNSAISTRAMSLNNSDNSTISPYVDIQQRLWVLNNELAVRYIPVIIYMFLLLVIGTSGNILVIIVYGQKKSKTSTHMFIINLAILDLLTCIIGMPTEIADLRYSLTFDAPVACKMLRAIEAFSLIGSTVTLIAISVDRYRRICKLGLQMTTVTAKRICVSSFVIGLLTCWPVAFVFGKKRVQLSELPGAEAVDCSTDDSVKGTIYPTLFYGFIFIYFVFCVAILTVLYTRMGIYVSRQRKKRISMIESRQSCHGIEMIDRKTLKEEGRKRETTKDTYPKESNRGPITRVMFVVTLAFILSFLPFLGVMLTRSLVDDFEEMLSKEVEVLYKFCLKSYFINNAINPIIYGFMNANFRKDVKNLCRRCRTPRKLSE